MMFETSKHVPKAEKRCFFLTHSLRSKAKQWMSFCGYGQNGVSKICVDGCDVVSENSGSDVTNWGNRSFRQRVSSPTTSSPTYEVVSPTSKVSSPTWLNYRIRGHFLLHAYQLFLVLLSTAEPNRQLNM